MIEILFPIALAVVAVLYSAVGQAGGTGYVALMGLAGFTPAIIKPTALALNVLVSGNGCVRFYRLGLLTWRSAYPFAALGLPFSLIGGALHLPPSAYQPVVGALLLIAGVQMARSAMASKPLDYVARDDPPFLGSLLVGGIIGLVSGMTGVGGGIFLAPLVLSLGWATTRQTAAISVVFNLVNSLLPLPGHGLPCRSCLPRFRSGWSAWVSEGFSAHGWARFTSTHEHYACCWLSCCWGLPPE